MSLTLFSPAKINLFLRILNKRPDGYHELASLFQAINLGDTLTFSLSSEDQLTCSDPKIPCDHTNLVIKALNLFRQATNLRFHVRIHLDKIIPTQAGLGGGSSNAATTLWGLNSLHSHPLSETELQTLSSQIGSDIPFFFSHGTAYCTGRGENVQDRPLPPNLGSLSIIKPKEGLSTPLIYKSLQLKECSTKDPEELLKSFYSGKPTYVNDLEIPAFRLCPILEPLKRQLQKQGHKTVWMSGSGTALVSFGNKGEIQPISRKDRQWYTT